MASPSRTASLAICRRSSVSLRGSIRRWISRHWTTSRSTSSFCCLHRKVPAPTTSRRSRASPACCATTTWCRVSERATRQARSTRCLATTRHRTLPGYLLPAVLPEPVGRACDISNNDEGRAPCRVRGPSQIAFMRRQAAGVSLSEERGFRAALATDHRRAQNALADRVSRLDHLDDRVVRNLGVRDLEHAWWKFGSKLLAGGSSCITP